MARPNKNISPETQALMSSRLREIRDASGLSQKQFAKKASYQQQRISAVECGDAPMTTGLANAIAQNFPVRAEYLLCWDDYRTDADYHSNYLKSLENGLDKFDLDALFSHDDAFEKLLNERGYETKLADVLKYPDVRLIKDDEILSSDIAVIKDGNVLCILTPAEEEALQNDVLDYYEFKIKKLAQQASGKEKSNGSK